MYNIIYETKLLIFNPDSSPVQQMTLDELPNLSTLLFICLQNKNSDIPHKVVMSFMSALRPVPSTEWTPNGFELPLCPEITSLL